MAWVKLDDHFPDHRKLAQCGPYAALCGWLYVCGLAWCNRQLTDGRIPKGHVDRLTSFRGVEVEVEEVAQMLVRVGLWDDDGDDYLIHDYLEYQPSKADVLALRDTRREVGQRGGQAKASKVLSNLPSNLLSKPLATRQATLVAKSCPVPVPDPVVPDPDPEPETQVSAQNADTCRPADAGRPAPGLTPADLQTLWNTHRGTLPRCQGLTKPRLQHAKARLTEQPTREYWVQVISRIADSAFCNGDSATGWRATFDWLLRPDTGTRVLEGKYDSSVSAGLAGRVTRHNQQAAAAWLDIHDAKERA